MPKGYWIVHVDIDDPAIYEDYKAANAAPFSAYGARFLVRGGPQTVVEGAARGRTVVLEFPTIEAAHACYASAGYEMAKALRLPVSTADIVIVAGFEA